MFPNPLDSSFTSGRRRLFSGVCVLGLPQRENGLVISAFGTLAIKRPWVAIKHPWEGDLQSARLLPELRQREVLPAPTLPPLGQGSPELWS